MKKRQWISLFLLFCMAGRMMAQLTPRRHSAASLNQNTRALLDEAMALGDRFWSNRSSLLEHPATQPGGDHPQLYLVRESSWYAMGLLLRDAPGDRERAAATLDAVLRAQYTTPGTRWYGTFRRSPEEGTPVGQGRMWGNYDPNWREFIGSAFAIILTEFPDRISADLARRMHAAIDCALQGEMQEGRLLPTYSNIALMYAFLLDYAAENDGHKEWRKLSASWSRRVYQLYKQHECFFEYNSPTYYGVDLFGLALWRSYGSTAEMRRMGSEMEASLWREIASYYSPSLRNLGGPFDRAYGMDMESYVSLTGVWLRTQLPAEVAPLPVVTPATDHLADIWFAPQIALLGAAIPQPALQSFTHFTGEHLLNRPITAQRRATAWIGDSILIGGEATAKTKKAGPESQFHPATIQWRTPSGKIGWVNVVESPMVDAIAGKDGLSISASGNIRLLIHADGTQAEAISAGRWNLPGLHIAASSDARDFHLENHGDALELTYTGLTKMRLKIERSGAAGPDAASQASSGQ